MERRAVDRPASWLGLPTEKALPGLLSYFQADGLSALRRQLQDDVVAVELPCSFPHSSAIYSALQFAKVSAGTNEERTLTAAGFFEDYEDPDTVGDFDWPDPAKYIHPEACRRAVQPVDDRAVLGMLWSCHFQDACAAFGMETALIKMLTEPEMFRAVIDRITEFYLRANEIFYEAAYRQLDAVLIGNDFGTQTGLMLSAAHLREFVFPGTKKLVDQAKRYGLKVIHHSCGSIADVIPDLIALGVDAIHPIQALAAGMDPVSLQRNFGNRVSFCGGVDAQQLLVHGTPEEVRQKVRELKAIFPTGLVISPSHEAILPDIPPANIRALFEAVRSEAWRRRNAYAGWRVPATLPSRRSGQ